MKDTPPHHISQAYVDDLQSRLTQIQQALKILNIAKSLFKF